MKNGEIWKNKKNFDFKVKISSIRFVIDGIETNNILLVVYKTDDSHYVHIGIMYKVSHYEFLESFEKDYDESGRNLETEE
jgi:hypothetical protein